MHNVFRMKLCQWPSFHGVSCSLVFQSFSKRRGLHDAKVLDCGIFPTQHTQIEKKKHLKANLCHTLAL